MESEVIIYTTMMMIGRREDHLFVSVCALICLICLKHVEWRERQKLGIEYNELE